MSNRIELPKPQSKTGLFLALLFKKHVLYQDNWTALTGNHNHAQRAYHLRKMGIPVKDTGRAIPPKYPDPLAFYWLDDDFINEVGQERKQTFIESVETFYSRDETTKKGLQSKPQPLASMIGRQASFGGGK